VSPEQVQPRYGVKLALPPKRSLREKVIAEGVFRDSADELLEDEQVRKTMGDMRDGITATAVMHAIVDQDLLSGTFARIEEASRGLQDAGVHNLDPKDGGLKVIDLTALLIFADTLAGDYTDQRVEEHLERLLKRLEQQKVSATN
jgi:hypothetical protein